MHFKHLRRFALAALACAWWSCASPAPTLEPIVGDGLVSLQLAPDISLEIDARMEFLAGTQIFNGWADTPYGDPGWFPPAYYHELKSLFAPYQDSPEMAVCRELHTRGLRFTGPIDLILASPGGFAFDTPKEPYAPDLIQQADAAEHLDAQLAAWRKLAVDTAFPAWFQSHLPHYRALIGRLAQDLPATQVSQWLHAWFGGDEALAFHYVASPGMMAAGSGGGSTLIQTENGRSVRHIYQFILGAESSNGHDLATTGLHEFAHSWVNPAIGGQIPENLRPALQKLYDRALPKMGNLPYRQLETYLNETVTRAVDLRGATELGLLPFGGAIDLFMHEQQGFLDLGTVYRILDEYAADRVRYSDFKSFGPVLLERLAASAASLP